MCKKVMPTSRPPKLLRDVRLVDSLAVQHLLPLGFGFLALMLGEVSDVFGVDEVFFLRVCADESAGVPRSHREEGTGSEHTLIMELFEMMDLVLILVVSVMAWSQLYPPQSAQDSHYPLLIPPLPNRCKHTPKSGNRTPFSHAPIHSSRSITPFLSISNMRYTSRVTSSLFSGLTSLALSSSSPYVRRTSSGVHPPEES